MTRSKRSNGVIGFIKLKSIVPTTMRCFITLTSIVLLSSCSDIGTDDPVNGVSDIVGNPDAPPDTASNTVPQNISPASPVADPPLNNTNTAQEDQAAHLTTLNSDGTTPTQPFADEPFTSEGVTPDIPGGIPQDCLFDISSTNVTFCLETESRTLRAWQPKGQPWWGYVLPGDNATNKIHALQIVNGSLYILAELKANNEQTGFEVSKFAFDGAFHKTIAIPKFHDYSFISAQRIQLADIGNNLIIAGDYGLSSNNILPNQFNGTFVAVFNTATDQVEKSILYPQLRQTNPIQTNEKLIRIELEHLVYDISLSNLELAEPVSRSQSIPFSRANYHQKTLGLIGFIEKPPFEELHTRMNEAYLQALRDQQKIEPNTPIEGPVACSSGGTVQQSIVVDEFDSEVRTTTFESCVMAEFSAHGVLLRRLTRTCGPNCEGLTKTLRALLFDVHFNNSESWSVDGFVSIKETRNTFNQTTGFIKNPETTYTNLTEFSVFNMSNNQLSIDLAQGQYQYDGTLESGIGSWVGAGTLTFANGVVETFSVDLLRQLLNGIQVDFSGQLEANRSDGTALYVAADTIDLASVRFTTTVGGESVQASDAW